MWAEGGHLAKTSESHIRGNPRVQDVDLQAKALAPATGSFRKNPPRQSNAIGRFSEQPHEANVKKTLPPSRFVLLTKVADRGGSCH